MRWQSNKYREARKAKNASRPMPEAKLFKCERVLAEAQLAVQELLHSAMAHNQDSGLQAS